MDINVHIPIILIIGIIIFILIIYSNFHNLKKEKRKIQEELKKLQFSINDLADQLFQKYKEKELENQKTFIAETALTNAKLKLEMWEMEWETFYRQDAISRKSICHSRESNRTFNPISFNISIQSKRSKIYWKPS